MRAPAKHGKDPEEEVHDEGLIKTANPNAPQKQHQMSQLDGSAPELTRREGRVDRQRRAAAYAKKHAGRRTRPRQIRAIAGREAESRRALATKGDQEEAAESLAKAQIEMMQGAQTSTRSGRAGRHLGGSFFEQPTQLPLTSARSRR